MGRWRQDLPITARAMTIFGLIALLTGSLLRAVFRSRCRISRS